MTDITIYKPASVTIRLVNGQYVIIKPAGMTIQAINGPPPGPFDPEANKPLSVKASSRLALAAELEVESGLPGLHPVG